MSEEVKNKDNFIWAWAKKNMAVLLMMVLAFFGEKFWSYIQSGAEEEFYQKVEQAFDRQEFKDNVKTVFRDQVISANVLKQVLDSPEIKDFTELEKEKLKRAFKKEILKNDSIRQSTESRLGEVSGIRDEDVMKELGLMLKDYKSGMFVRRDDRRTIGHNF